jgi:hypothetical protein
MPRRSAGRRQNDCRRAWIVACDGDSRRSASYLCRLELNREINMRIGADAHRSCRIRRHAEKGRPRLSLDTVGDQVGRANVEYCEVRRPPTSHAGWPELEIALRINRNYRSGRRRELKNTAAEGRGAKHVSGRIDLEFDYDGVGKMQGVERRPGEAAVEREPVEGNVQVRRHRCKGAGDYRPGRDREVDSEYVVLGNESRSQKYRALASFGSKTRRVICDPEVPGICVNVGVPPKTLALMNRLSLLVPSATARWLEFASETGSAQPQWRHRVIQIRPEKERHSFMTRKVRLVTSRQQAHGAGALLPAIRAKLSSFPHDTLLSDSSKVGQFYFGELLCKVGQHSTAVGSLRW